ncbi:MAG TPA: anthranilate phosphoribosyltransferase, partial [Candidatus Omnitrophota bacterium]|nr:anthranilate phosphoribosyltransferase [Candidatus Omnitrophota bacterium]
MIEEYIKKVLAGHDLETAEMEKAVSFIAQGKVPGKEIAELLLGLANKKETADEITGAAIALRRFVKPIHVKKDVIL